MKLFFKRVDGGAGSNVTGYWLIEWKRCFSIALLRFSPGARDCHHSHAFNCVSWVLSGRLTEHRVYTVKRGSRQYTEWSAFPASFKPVITTRDNLHRVHSQGTTWVLTFRGPWADKWRELIKGRFVTLTHGRKEVA